MISWRQRALIVLSLLPPIQQMLLWIQIEVIVEDEAMNKEEQLYKSRALLRIQRNQRVKKILSQPRKEINTSEVDNALEVLKGHIHDLMYIANLTDKESQVLLQRCAGDTQKTIADKYKCTKQCIQQTQRSALRKIKEIMQVKELEAYHTLIDALPYLRIANVLLNNDDKQEGQE